MAELRVDIPASLIDRAQRFADEHDRPIDAVVSDAIRRLLEHDAHTVFQISTAGALVEGVYSGAATVGVLRAHGNFGLGTFEGLDGEMIVVDGEVFQVRADGRVRVVSDEVTTPFAVLTNYEADREISARSLPDLAAIVAVLDRARDTDNVFFAVRVEGTFSHLHVRAACQVPDGTPLVEATKRQSEWIRDDVDGVMVGFYSPAYSAGIDVAGYHLHFVDARRSFGGHILDAGLREGTIGLQRLDHLEVDLPETAAFLNADLSHDARAALDVAEHEPEAGDVDTRADG